MEEGIDAFPVRITIVQDDVTTGWDDGALGFEDDAVWFSGRATSFRLAAPDILPGAYLLSRREAVTHGEALNQGFPLRHPTREVWVRVKVLTAEEGGRMWDEKRLVEGIKGLRARKEGGLSAYPPLAPRPGLMPPDHFGLSPRDRSNLRTTAMGLILLGQVLQVFVHFLPGWGLAPLLAGTALCFIRAPGPDEPALRRIAREEASA